MKYVIPAALAFLVGFALWQFERQRTSIDYEVVTSEAFPRESGVGRYFVVRLRNTGNKEVRDVDLDLSLRSGGIEKKQFSDPSLISQLAESPTQIRGRLPLLNPGEVFAVTVTAVGQSDAGPLDVTARAPGATATPRSDDQLSSQVLGLLTGAVAVGGAVLAFSLFSSYRSTKLSESIAKIENLGEVSKRIEKTEDSLSAQLQRQHEERQRLHEERMSKLEEEQRRQEQGQPDTAELIFAVFNRCGISHRFRDVASNGEIKYWGTAIFLLHSFLLDEQNAANYVAAAEAMVELPGMAPSSRGFTLYLLAKMEQFRGNSERAIRWFERCKAETPLMHEHLMSQDPAYDLNKLRRLLVRGGPEASTSEPAVDA